MRAVFIAILLGAGFVVGDPDVIAQRQAEIQTLIDFSVIGTDGSAVTDLTAKDVTLKVGGRPREITFFQLVRADGEGAAVTAPLLPPPYATNVTTGVGGRDILVIIDEESIAPGRLQRARDAIREFISHLGPTDRVALLSPRQGGPRITLDDRTDLGNALGKFASAVSSDAQHLQCRTITTLQMLQGLFAGYSGRYTPTIVFVSGGIAAPPGGGRGFVTMGTGGKCELTLKHFHDTGAASKALQGNLYVVYAPELTQSQTPETAASSGLDTLAGTIGASFLTGTIEEGLSRVTRETAAHYLIGFEPDPKDRPAAPQRVELAVARDRVKVRFRSEVVPLGGTSARAKKASPDDMLRTAESHTDLPLRATAYPSRTEDGKIRLVVLFEPAEADVKLKNAAVGLYDAKGRLTRWSADGGELARSPVMAGIIVPAGAYRMRVAAVESTGRAGTVDTQTVADLVDAGPVKLSGLVLGVSDSAGTFSPRLQFSNEPGAFGYLEIYNVPKGADVKVVQEVADSVDGRALATFEIPLAPGSTEDSRIAYQGFAIEPLPPGDLLVRAIVSVDGKVVGRAMRTLRKVK